jgi:hypothetical protein
MILPFACTWFEHHVSLVPEYTPRKLQWNSIGVSFSLANFFERRNASNKVVLSDWSRLPVTAEPVWIAGHLDELAKSLD